MFHLIFQGSNLYKRKIAHLKLEKRNLHLISDSVEVIFDFIFFCFLDYAEKKSAHSWRVLIFAAAKLSTVEISTTIKHLK